MRLGPARGCLEERRGVGDRTFGSGLGDRHIRPGQPQCDEASDPGKERPDAQGSTQPEHLDEDEPRKERAGNGAQRVGRVQASEGLAEGARSTEVAHESREGGAHHDRRRRQRQDREDEARDRQERRAFEGRVDAAIDVVDEPERQRRHQHDHDERDLQETVQPERRTNPVGDPTSERGPDGHPPEEPGEDRRHGLRGVPEHENELAGPDDLVDEPRRAGQDEDADDGGGALHGRSVACRRVAVPVTYHPAMSVSVRSGVGRRRALGPHARRRRARRSVGGHLATAGGPRRLVASRDRRLVHRDGWHRGDGAVQLADGGRSVRGTQLAMGHRPRPGMGMGRGDGDQPPDPAGHGARRLAGVASDRPGGARDAASWSGRARARIRRACPAVVGSACSGPGCRVRPGDGASLLARYLRLGAHRGL